MQTRISLSALLCLGLSQLAGAADHRASVRTSTEGPRPSIDSSVVGYFRSSSGLVAVEGISNAAHARSVVAPQADRIVMPPGQAYEWLERDGQVYITPLPDSQLRAIPGVWSGADLVSFNPSASTAVLYRAPDRLQVVGGLPGLPRILREIAAPPGVTALAISDDSIALLAATSTGVYAFSGNSDWRLVMAETPSAMTFIKESHNAIVAFADQIDLLKDLTVAQWIAAAVCPVAIASSDDGRLAVVLNAAGREAIVLDMQTNVVTRLALGMVAKDVERGRDGTLIFIPQQGNSPWLLDAKSAGLSFAPELPDSVQGR